MGSLSVETGGGSLLIDVLGTPLFVGAILAVAGLVVWRAARRQRAAGGSWRYFYGNAPTRTTDTTLSQTRPDGEVTMSLADVARVRLVETPKPLVRVGNFEQSGKFYVVQVDDRDGGSIYVERLLSNWTVWGTRLVEQGSPVRSILQDLLPRLPPEAEVDPRVRAYAETGTLSRAS